MISTPSMGDRRPTAGAGLLGADTIRRTVIAPAQLPA